MLASGFVSFSKIQLLGVMAISANTLFRFVTDIKWLKKVLEDCAFEPRYSIEYDKKNKKMEVIMQFQWYVFVISR